NETNLHFNDNFVGGIVTVLNLCVFSTLLPLILIINVQECRPCDGADTNASDSHVTSLPSINHLTEPGINDSPALLVDTPHKRIVVPATIVVLSRGWKII